MSIEDELRAEVERMQAEHHDRKQGASKDATKDTAAKDTTTATNTTIQAPRLRPQNTNVDCISFLQLRLPNAATATTRKAGADADDGQVEEEDDSIDDDQVDDDDQDASSDDNHDDDDDGLALNVNAAHHHQRYDHRYDPSTLLRALCHDLVERGRGVPRSRYILRILPVQQTCHANASAIENCARHLFARVLPPLVHDILGDRADGAATAGAGDATAGAGDATDGAATTASEETQAQGQTPSPLPVVRFAIQFRQRFTGDTLDRDALVATLAGLVLGACSSASAPPIATLKVDLKEPELVVLVEVIKVGFFYVGGQEARGDC